MPRTTRRSSQRASEASTVASTGINTDTKASHAAPTTSSSAEELPPVGAPPDLHELLERPEDFFQPAPAVAVKFEQLMKELYGQGRLCTKFLRNDLPPLIVEGFDREQIWSEIELQNKPLLGYITKTLPKIKKESQKQATPEKVSNKTPKVSSIDLQHQSDDLDNLDNLDDSEVDEENQPGSAKKQKTSGSGGESKHDLDDSDDSDTTTTRVPKDDEESENNESKRSDSGSQETKDDQESDEHEGDEGGDEQQQNEEKQMKVSENSFFRMDDMERFADMDDGEFEDNRGLDEEEYEDDDREDRGDNGDPIGPEKALYLDFFDEVSGERAKDSFEEEIIFEDDGEGEERTQTLGEDHGTTDTVDPAEISAFERENLRMREKITELESKVIEPREWMQMGEASSKDRPADSLLEVPLEFDHASKLPPIITKETTVTLEDMIKQRIIDSAFDDVERKAEPKEKAFKPMVEVSQEKSSLGLAEVYEKEYVEKMVASAGGKTEQEQKLNEHHREIALLFANLCHKLDALSNFHYTPKPPSEELVVRTKAPAIQIEEIVPVGVSDAQTVAPQELYKNVEQGKPVGDTETTQEDRKRRRRVKKHKLKVARTNKQLEQKAQEKLNPELKARREAAEAMKKQQKQEAKTATPQVNDSTNYTKSSEFFAKIQEQARSKDSRKPPQTKRDSVTAKHVKL